MTAEPQKLRIAVLYGGRSAEHAVSVLSATNVMAALDPARYDLMPVYIARDGRWFLGTFENGIPSEVSGGEEVCLVPGGHGRVVALSENSPGRELPTIDLLFPVLHGLHGEDGSVQGLAEVACVPLAGCGILGSANALDKDMAKALLNEAGVAVARSMTIRSGAQPGFPEVRDRLGLPVFIKPARQGSSVGVSKVSSEADYADALAEGFRHDDKLLVEEFIEGREIECSVLEDTEGGLFVSRPGEIVPAEKHGFYTYDAKYIDADGAALKIPAELPSDVETQVRAIAAKAFRALGCDAMARVDFFVTGDGRILLNEVNTIPGFTNISMYPKAMEASGVSYREILDRLVEHGIARAQRRI